EPGGAAYPPALCNKSARLTPAARTRTRTKSPAGSGVSISRTSRTSGPPALVMTTAFIRFRSSLKSHPLFPLRPEQRGNLTQMGIEVRDTDLPNRHDGWYGPYWLHRHHAFGKLCSSIGDACK